MQISRTYESSSLMLPVSQLSQTAAVTSAAVPGGVGV